MIINQGQVLLWSFIKFIDYYCRM